MIDLRYHLASLIAVFIALGIGMLIGNSFVGLASAEAQTPLLKRLERNVGEVREQVQAIQEENATLRDQINDHERAIRSLSPRVLGGLLKNRHVALVIVGRPEPPETATQLSSLLTAAGASVVSTTQLPVNWLPRDDEARAQMLRLFNVVASDTDRQDASRVLAHGIVDGAQAEALHEAARLNPDLSLDGDYAQPVGSVILLTYLPQLNDA